MQVLRELPPAPPGSLALLKAADGEILAKGYYDRDSRLAFRALTTAAKERLDSVLVEARLSRAAALREALFAPFDATSGASKPYGSTPACHMLFQGQGQGPPLLRRHGRVPPPPTAALAPGFRLVNGEGDGLPGLIVDVYDTAAVMKLDGAGGPHTRHRKAAHQARCAMHEQQGRLSRLHTLHPSSQTGRSTRSVAIVASTYQALRQRQPA